MSEETIVKPAEIDDAAVVLEDQQFDIDTMTVVVEEIKAAKGIHVFYMELFQGCKGWVFLWDWHSTFCQILNIINHLY